MIKSLTKEQEKLVPIYLDKWLKVGYRITPIDRTKAEKAVNFLYEKIMQVQKPKQILFLDSPMACQVVINSQLENQLRNQLRNQLWNQLRNQLWNQLRNQLENQLRNQLWNQLENQLRNQLENQLRNQLWNQLRNQLWNQLRNQLVYEDVSNWSQSYYWYYDFILNELLPSEVPKFKLYTKYLQHSKELHFSYFFPEIAILSDFPCNISLDKNNNLHRENGKALEYRDGYGIFACHGQTANSSLELALL
jgi:hypothetical protein